MSCTCGCDDKPTIADIRHHRAVKAANEVCDLLDAYDAAYRRYAHQKTPKNQDAMNEAYKVLSDARRRRREAKEAALRVDHGG